jgi:hypothetical protein
MNHEISRISANWKALGAAAVFLVFFWGAVSGTMAQRLADTYASLSTPEVVILYPAGMRSAAEDVYRVYPIIRNELEQLTGWPLHFRPQIALIGQRSRFQQMAGDDRIEAFARAHDRFIAIDYSRLAGRPLRMTVTLKHELTHLLLHDQIQTVEIPKWLNEGVAQWASGGIGEVLVRAPKSLIGDAMRNDRLPSMAALADRFPDDSQGFSLAYEISLSFMTHIEENYGRRAIIDILSNMKNGLSVYQAVEEALGTSLPELESEWRKRVKKQEGWLSFMAMHIYEFLFFAGALLSIFGFMRYWIKKKNYRDDDEEEDW